MISQFVPIWPWAQREPPEAAEIVSDTRSLSQRGPGMSAELRPMWRLLPILVGLGFLELLVPWPHVAALVLGGTSPTELHDSTSGVSVASHTTHLGHPARLSVSGFKE
jgi:hypothetical protein